MEPLRGARPTEVYDIPVAMPTFEDRSALSEFIGETSFNRDGICTEPGFPRTLGQVEN
jgi:hypothetical protein